MGCLQVGSFLDAPMRTFIRSPPITYMCSMEGVWETRGASKLPCGRWLLNFDLELAVTPTYKKSKGAGLHNDNNSHHHDNRS